jgi:hypothetical protein
LALTKTLHANQDMVAAIDLSFKNLESTDQDLLRFKFDNTDLQRVKSGVNEAAKIGLE